MTDFDAPIGALGEAGVKFIIKTKRAAGRPRGLKAIAALEALLEEPE